MATMADAAGGAGAPRKVLVYRHRLATRVTHWLNALAIILLLGTGLNILMAHPRLYWGHYGSVHDTAWLEFRAVPGEARGETVIFGHVIDTTGFLGWSGDRARTFPEWATIPSGRDLATARSWHFLAAWLLIINGLAYWLLGLANRHIGRDMVPTAHDLSPRNLWQDFYNHLLLKYPKGRDSLHYHPMQKLAYFAVIAVLVPGIILTGMTMSPSLNASLPFLVDLFGGRQSARSLHFIFAMSILAFIIIHLVQVVLAGVWNEVRSMVTGKWQIEEA